MTENQLIEENSQLKQTLLETNKTLEILARTVNSLQISVEDLSKRLPTPPEQLKVEEERELKFYNFRENFIAGSIALPLSFAMMHPVDTIKTRMQASSTKLEITSNIENGIKNGVKNGISKGFGNGGFFAHLRSAISTSGSLVLSRGFVSSVVGASPQGGLRLGTYGFVQREIHPYFDSPILQNAVAAIAGDVASSIVKVPREVLTQRLQTGIYNSTSQAIRSIFQQEGIKGFYTGFISTTLRDIPFMVVLFVSYEQFKQWKVRLTTTHMRGTHHHDKPWSDFETVLWGGISGGLAGFSTTPMDVIKTRIMTETKNNVTSSMKSTITNILKEEGPRGLFVGAVPRSTWWFCVCSIFFASFERIRVATSK